MAIGLRPIALPLNAIAVMAGATGIALAAKPPGKKEGQAIRKAAQRPRSEP